MEASKANLINSITLITIGGWGYFSGSSMTALIPVMFGVVLLLCNNGIKKENKLIAHLAVLATIICLLGLFMPLKGALENWQSIDENLDNLKEGFVSERDSLNMELQSASGRVARVSIMIITCTIAIVSFVQSFIKARRKN